MTKRTRRPEARNRAIARTAPGIGSCASHTTPSRSHSTVSGPSQSPIVATDFVWHPVSVPRFTPFPALRYSVSTIDDLIAPPYDVLSDDDLDELNARDRFNITHVDVPRGVGRSRSVRAAGNTLQAVDRRGRLAFDPSHLHAVPPDASPMPAGPHATSSACSVDSRSARTGSRRRAAARAGHAEGIDGSSRPDPGHPGQLSPIWGLSFADGLTDLLVAPGEPIASVTIDGVEHTVERVTDPVRLQAISETMATDDVLIADGHHRYGVAEQYRDEMRTARVVRTPMPSTRSRS